MQESRIRRREMLIAAGGAALAAAAGAQSSPAAAEAKQGQVVTSDGVKLSYIDAGAGKTLVMIPGWSQTAAQFKHQTRDLSDNYRLIAIDMRGHGESEKVDHGYKISRLSKDLHDVLIALDLHDVTLLGHSMGCSVIWSYWDLFGPERISKLALIDQMPFITANPKWSAEEKRDAGALFDPVSLYDTCNALAGPDGEKTTAKFIGGMVTKAMPAAETNWIVVQNLKLPRRSAADLLYNHATQDWRDVIPRINVPTLVVGGKASLVPWPSQVWISQQIKGSRLVIFEEDEGGAHFMFMENPDKFNRLIRDLIT